MVRMPHWPKNVVKGVDEFSLDVVREGLKRLGNPHHYIPPVVYVTGTNGKGSVTAYMKSIAASAGMKVHCYTSPHLLDINERIVVANNLISDKELFRILETCRAATTDIPFSFFEGVTLAAFLAFARSDADLTILEVGMGGRLDATNVVESAIASVFAPISMDHAEFLGKTEVLIAVEKSGVMRKGATCVIGSQKTEVLQELEKQSVLKSAYLFRKGFEWDCGPINFGERMFFENSGVRIDLPRPSLKGLHQIDNAGLAIATMLVVSRRINVEIFSEDFTVGISSAIWPARIEKIVGPVSRLLPKDWELYMDGAHNPAGAKVLVDWAESLNKRIIFIVGMSIGKDGSEFMAQIGKIASKIFTVCVKKEPCAFSATNVADFAKRSGYEAEETEGLRDAITKAAKLFPDDKVTVIVCGSLYLYCDLDAINKGENI